MKKIFVVTILLLPIISCSKGKVGVTSSQGNNSAVGLSKQAKSSKPVVSSNQPSPVFFLTTSVEDNHAQRVTGIGYLSTLSKVDNPYTFHISSNNRSPQNHLFTRVSGGIAEVRSLDESRDSVSITSVPDLGDFELFSSDVKIQKLAGSGDFKWLGWIDEQGKVYIKNRGAAFNVLDAPNFVATDLEFRSGADRLLVLGTNNKNKQSISEALIFDIKDDPKGMAEIQADSASLSAKGKWLALVSGKTLSLQNLDNPEMRLDVPGIVGRVVSVTWKDDTHVAYVTESLIGKGQLRVFDVNEQKSILVSEIRLPSKIHLKDVVCPSWSGGNLYFGSFSDERFLILKGAKKQNRWSVSSFAKPSQASEGYVCPLENAGGS